ncbi:ACT domain-containing protein [Paraburkholderia sp. J11-2]|uniref:ACT domain-containing protein n=1 Tax=Paraburkholderia sp. J11-2 TaxID=2805431 RepID=UPI002AB79477|nr:ACT domain-containing protein [Paraburkholderia sp. J11-2]
MGEIDLAKLCATMKPVMAPAVYVYCSFPEFNIPTGLPCLCTFRESEGLTAIVERTEAQRLGVCYTYAARLITLSVHSSLNAVGFIAVISRTLAEAKIPCNIIAGYYHDHLLVPVDQADEAMTQLHEISTSAL